MTGPIPTSWRRTMHQGGENQIAQSARHGWRGGLTLGHGLGWRPRRARGTKDVGYVCGTSTYMKSVGTNRRVEQTEPARVEVSDTNAGRSQNDNEALLLLAELTIFKRTGSLLRRPSYGPPTPLPRAAGWFVFSETNCALLGRSKRGAASHFSPNPPTSRKAAANPSSRRRKSA